MGRAVTVRQKRLLDLIVHQRSWSALVLCTGLCACVASTDGAQRPIPDIADFHRREDCLYRAISRLISERDSVTGKLEDIAIAATAECSQEIWSKMAENNSPTSDRFLMAGEDKQLTEHYALQIAMKIKKMRSKK
jgi:type II secretory pathway component PulJ